MGNFGQLAHPEYLVILAAMLLIVYLVRLNKLPDVQQTIDLINALNTKGGNILVLAAMTFISMFIGIHFLYWTLDKVQGGKLDATEALIGMGFQWISGGVCIGSLSALFKTMSPEDMTTATKPSTSTKETTQTTTEKVTPPTEPSSAS